MQQALTCLLQVKDKSAEDPSIVSADLLALVSRLFQLCSEELNQADRDFFGEVLGQIAYGLDKGERAALAQRLAHDEHAPQNITARLANDEFYIAEQLLLHSTCLGEQDLVDIVENRSLDHVGSVCQRETLSDTLTDAIVDRGAAAVLGALLRNNGAKFSKHAWAKIHEMAAGDDKLLQLAGRRAGKAPVPNDVEKKKAASGPVDGVVTEATLQKVAKSNDLDGTVEQLATLIQQDPRFVRHCLMQPEIKALIIVCKAEDLSDDTFAALVQLRLQQRTTQASEVADAIKRYQDISVEHAQDFLSKRK